MLGFALGDAHYHRFPADHVKNLLASGRLPAVLEGRIVDEPSSRSHAYLHWTSLRIEAEALTLRGERRKTSGLVAAYLSSDDPVPARYGQRVRMTGEIAPPEPPGNPGETDRRAGYAHARIHAVFSLGKGGRFEVLDEHAGSRVLGALIDLRTRLRTSLLEAAPGPAGAFLDAILLGTREDVDPAIIEDFVRTGTIHVLAISGQHLFLFAAFMELLLLRLLRMRPAAAHVAVIGFAILYCLLTGAHPTILRATIMLVIYLGGRLVQAEPRRLNSLAIAAIVILARNPGDLMSVGFQLSFSAILGLELLFKPLKAACLALLPPLGPRPARSRRLAFRTVWVAGDLLLASLAAWVATAPLILWHYNLLTLGTVPANIAVLLPVVAVLDSGLLLMFVAPLSPLLAKPLAWIACGASEVLVGLVERLAEIPGFFVYLPSVRGEQVALSYVALGGFAIAAARRFHPRWLAATAPVLAVLSLVPLPPDAPRPGTAEVAVLAVGKGITSVVRTPGTTVLFDCGSGKIIDPAPRLVAPYLWSKGVRRIDAVFLSHAHDDHMNALLATADRFPVGRVYVNPAFARTVEGASFLGMLAARGIAFTPLERGDRVDLRDLSVKVLAPDEAPLPALGSPVQCMALVSELARQADSAKDDQNNRSLVLRVDVAGQRLLYPGDLEEAGLQALLRSTENDDLAADVLLIPHHGSGNKWSQELARRVRPRIAIASTKEHFARAQTLSAYDDVGTACVETWTTGCVELRLDRATLSGRAFRQRLPAIPGERPAAPALPPTPPAPPLVVGAPAPPADDAGLGDPPSRRRRVVRRIQLGDDEELRARRRARREGKGAEDRETSRTTGGGEPEDPGQRETSSSEQRRWQCAERPRRGPCRRAKAQTPRRHRAVELGEAERLRRERHGRQERSDSRPHRELLQPRTGEQSKWARHREDFMRRGRPLADGELRSLQPTRSFPTPLRVVGNPGAYDPFALPREFPTPLRVVAEGSPARSIAR